MTLYWLIVGAGALGLLWLAITGIRSELARRRYDPAFLHRPLLPDRDEEAPPAGWTARGA